MLSVLHLTDDNDFSGDRAELRIQQLVFSICPRDTNSSLPQRFPRPLPATPGAIRSRGAGSRGRTGTALAHRGIL